MTQHYGKPYRMDPVFFLVGWTYIFWTVGTEFLMNYWQVLLFLVIFVFLGYLRCFDDGALFILSFGGVYILITLLEHLVSTVQRRWQ